MKWNRIELKEMAKTALRGSYWKSVLAAFLLAIATSALTSSSGWKVGADEVSDISDSVYGLLPLIFAVVLVAGCIGMALCAFVLRPLEVGCRRYFLEDIYYPADLNTLKAGFSGNYLNIVWIMFCRDIFTFLWTLLFIVPGIVKSYEYKMIPYLLAENPNLSREEAFALSKRM
ncbi:MAG: hypothetical protein Q4A32_12110, partial [Lachnospiraceae bacterium]|nr:hypothetical protein [Lachnospiraceae bacterium]